MPVTFQGAPEAELFAREVRETIAGVLKHNYGSVQDIEPGFIRTSPPGHPYDDQLWTRDAGVWLREMAHWGHLDEACEAIRCMFRYVQPDADGVEFFPVCFNLGEHRDGTELDGTSAIFLGAALVIERLPLGDPRREELWGCLTRSSSALYGILSGVERDGWLAGTGEFGGGFHNAHEPCFNSVQQNLTRVMLLAVARVADARGESALINRCRVAADRLMESLLTRLRYADGEWLWALRAPGGEMDWELLTSVANDGFGGINGILTMSADAQGFLPAEINPDWYESCERTFLNLMSHPLRMREFSAYGAFRQFNRLKEMMTTASYGHGYAMQSMLLLDLPDLYTPAIRWFANATLEPQPGQNVRRMESPYYFYEFYYTPTPLEEGISYEVGGATLNLVNAMEPCKVARLILGADDHQPGTLRLIPRLPIGWRTATAEGMPILTPGGPALIDLAIDADETGAITAVSLTSDRPLPAVSVRLGTARRPHWEMRENTDGFTARW